MKNTQPTQIPLNFDIADKCIYFSLDKNDSCQLDTMQFMLKTEEKNSF